MPSEMIDREMINSAARKLYRTCVAGTDFEKSIQFEDLVHAGVQGYLSSSARLDHDQFADPQPFLRKRVYGEMLDMLRRQSLVHLPQKKYGLLKQLRAARRKLEQSGADVDEKLLADYLGWTLAELQELQASAPRIFSDQLETGGDENFSLFDVLETEQGRERQLSAALQKELLALLEICLSLLDDARLRFILVARFQEDLTLRELAAQFGVSEQAIHYQATKGLGRMRDCLESRGWHWDGGEEYLF